MAEGDVLMDDKVRAEIDAAKALASMALNKINTHEAVCLERYTHLLKTLVTLEETVKAVVVNTSVLPWKFVIGTTVVGGFLIAMVGLAIRMVSGQ